MRRVSSQSQQHDDALIASLTQRVDELTALCQTAEQRIAQWQQLDVAKTRFLSIASHEIKTPLTSISGYLQIAIRRARRRLGGEAPGPADWEAGQRADLEQLELINKQTGKLVRLIDDLLTYSRVKASERDVHIEPINLRTLAADVFSLVQPTAPRHTLRLALKGKVEPIVQGDREQLERVVNNLVSNAVTYAPVGGVIRVEVRARGEQVELNVHDPGIGIVADELERVFEIFYRTQAGRALNDAGTGFGLYISKEIVLQHGGRMWAESRQGVGSTFFVVLPRAPKPSAAA